MPVATFAAGFVISKGVLMTEQVHHTRRIRRRLAVIRRRETGPTLGEFLDVWLSGKQRLRASTARAYRIHVERHIRPMLGPVLLRDLSLADLQQFYVWLAAREGGGLSSASVQRVHATLSSALNAAVRRGMIEVSPTAWVEATGCGSVGADHVVVPRGAEVPHRDRRR